MSDITFERDYPLPKEDGRAFREKRLSDDDRKAISDLEVGQSFLVNMKTAMCAYDFARRNGLRLTGRKQEDGRVRMWRVANVPPKENGQ